MLTPLAAPVLSVRNVSKRFGVVQALRSVTLDVHAGQVLALVGENGAGKSTLMRIIEGVFPADAGEILVDGRPLVFREPRDAHAAGIRIIHQEPEIVPELTVAENLYLGAMPSRGGVFIGWKRLRERTQALLERFHMSAELEPMRRCTRLGPAQRQVIEIMRAVRAGGRVIAFDEPTSSLADDEARRLFQVIRSLAADGVAIIYISHRLHEVEALADRVAVLRDGELVAERDAAGLEQAEIARLMVGRDLSSLLDRKTRAPGEPLLEVRDLETEKVHGVSLTVRRGEVLGIGGLMGAGRSELAKAIVGFDRRIAGSIAMRGRPVAPDSPAGAILAGIGLAPEDRKLEALLLFRSVLDNIVLCVPDKVGIAGIFQRGTALAIAGGLAVRLGIKTPSLDTAVANLSGGNQQKVVLARWLAREPMVLILDEPTRGIDIGAKTEIYRLIDELAAAGIGILLISSEMPELIGLADRILVMAEGRITGEIDRAHADEDAILALAMRKEPSEGAAARW